MGAGSGTLDFADANAGADAGAGAVMSGVAGFINGVGDDILVDIWVMPVVRAGAGRDGRSFARPGVVNAVRRGGE